MNRTLPRFVDHVIDEFGLARRATLRAMAKPPPSADSPFWKVFNGFAKLNVVVFRATRGKVGAKMMGAPVGLVHHVGAKSGTHRVQPLIYLEESGRWLIVASKGGTDRHPAWFHNLKANPDTEIELPGRKVAVRARVLDADERAEVWPKLVAIYKPYAQYQEHAGDRVIPVVSLDPR